MALWDKLKTELDRAGRVAQTAIDEGKVRLEVMRVRQLADRSAEALGYAVFRAHREGRELDAETFARLTSTLAAHEAEVERLEAQMAREGSASASAAGAPPAGGTEGAAAHPGAAEHAPADAEASGRERPVSHVDPAMGDDPEHGIRGGV